jgi:hypothetical protein
MLQIQPHLKTKEVFVEKNDISYSDELIECFVKACTNLDVAIFEPLMHEDDVFEDKDKYRFLSSLKILFEEYRNENTVSFKVYALNDVCNGCKLGKPVKSFKIFAMKKDPITQERLFCRGQFAFLIELENGILNDIYRCNRSLCNDSKY